jgi:hypothetical protein
MTGSSIPEGLRGGIGAGELALAGKLGEIIEQSFNQLYICSTIKV